MPIKTRAQAIVKATVLLLLVLVPAYVPASADNTQFSKPATQGTIAPRDGHGYINSDGNWVHSPMRTPDNKVPPGASAQCRDGTYSFSQHHSGTCSHHGGVAQWL